MRPSLNSLVTLAAIGLLAHSGRILWSRQVSSQTRALDPRLEPLTIPALLQGHREELNRDLAEYESYLRQLSHIPAALYPPAEAALVESRPLAVTNDKPKGAQENDLKRPPRVRPGTVSIPAAAAPPLPTILEGAQQTVPALPDAYPADASVVSLEGRALSVAPRPGAELPPPASGFASALSAVAGALTNGMGSGRAALPVTPSDSPDAAFAASNGSPTSLLFAADDRRPGRGDVVVFVHIPKTAGSVFFDKMRSRAKSLS